MAWMALLTVIPLAWVAAGVAGRRPGLARRYDSRPRPVRVTAAVTPPRARPAVTRRVIRGEIERG